jgi:hypothetical protein
MKANSTTARAFILPRLQDILFVSVFLAAMLLGPVMLNMDGDLPRHLLTGRYIFETRSAPTTEPFAYPYQGKPFTSHAHDWISDSVFYLIYQIAGLAGLAIFAAFLLATTFFVLYSYAVKSTNLRLPTLVFVIWGVAATSLNWVTRPFLISMLLLAIWLIWLDELNRAQKIELWYFPLLMILWCNMHGEFIAGFLALFAYGAGWIWDFLFAGERVNKTVGKNLLLVTGISFLASLVNPAGIAPWKTMFGFVNNSYLMSRMYEARQPDYSQPEFMVLLGLLAFSIFLLGIKKQKIPTAKAILLAGFSGMTLIAGRNVHLYGIVAPFVLAGALEKADLPKILKRLEDRLYQIEIRLRGVLWPFFTFIVCALLVYTTPLGQIYKFSDKMFPIQATEWLLENPQSGYLFNDLNWGGYLAFHLWPEHKVFVDSMTDTTGKLTREYESVITLSPIWKDVLSKYQVNWAIIQPASQLAYALKQEGWSTLYEDQTAVILGK